MGQMIKIAPSILAADITNLAADVKDVENLGAELLHIDIMDGHFVPNLSFGPHVVAGLRPISKLIFDVHLMLENPIDYIKPFADAGADIITVQVESKSDTQMCIDLIHSLGKKAGIVINPDTPATPYLKFVNQVEMALIMSVYPGFGGQKFMEEVVSKITEIRSYAGENFDIEVDGGINTDNCEIIKNAGANVIVAGSSIFGAENREKVIGILKQG